MERAVLLIGVQQAGPLTRLKAVLDGIQAMNEWAVAQNIATVEVITDAPVNDEPQKVTIADITAAMQRILTAGPPDQLIVYFAGHGINKVYSEYWLLSDAPQWADQAVNVTASAELARRCGIPHVVFISDACRTAPDGIGAQAITGAPIFPNIAGARPGSVDLFFANHVGEPAFEIADPRVATSRFTSAFTDVLTRSLNGMYSELLENQPDEPGTMILRPWPLNRALPDLLLDELERLGVDLTINQQPDALISSDPTQAWLSEVSAKRSISFKPKIPTPPTLTEKIGESVSLGVPVGVRPFIELSGRNVVLDMTFGSPSAPSDPGTSHSAAPGNALTPIERLSGDAAEVVTVDWANVEPASDGVRVHGASVTRSVQGADATFVELDGELCTNLARLEGFDCCALIAENNLVSVHWQATGTDESPELQHTRAALAAASRSGLLRLDVDQAHAVRERLAERDPSVEVYLAYAQRPSTAHPDDCFDLGLLTDGATITTANGAIRWPGFPLLSRGFGLLQAIPDQSRSHPAHLALALSARAVPSHWSLFTLQAEPFLTQLLDISSPT